jgi:CheY-like chemotaxis protein
MSSDESVITQPLDGIRVLAVEDFADSREFLVVLLEIHGASVTAVGSARDALEELDRDRFDILVSDINLPDETGHDLIRLVRARPPERGGQIPAIALTAMVQADDRASVLASGFQAHLGKPVEPDDLVTVIKALAAAGIGE